MYVADSIEGNVMQTDPEVQARVEQALARREFVLHYQPKVDLRNGRVLGAEALIRWQHPERGLLVPGHFLPAIDATPSSATLGSWVLDTAMTQLDVWRREGFDFSVSVNIADCQLQSDGFADELRSVMGRHPAVPPETVELEVREPDTIEDIGRVAHLVEACHGLGLRVALDYFGTGQASLVCLRNIRVDALKIDQSFVRNMLEDDEDLAVVESVSGLARAFRRQVSAVGVETAAHCVALINLGCHVGQGYGIARPMPAQELADWVCSRPAPAG
jgi:EAL domain-containing protein (putative c-di-GMP-specific phosphodiesterase class I)